MQAVNKNPSPSQVRSFGLTMLGGLAVIGALLWYEGRLATTGWGYAGTGLHVAALVLWGIGLAFALICSTLHTFGKRVYVAWMTGIAYVGMVMSTTLLTVLFFVFLPVFSLIRFADPLRLKRKRAGSYWEEHTPYEPTVERTMRPF